MCYFILILYDFFLNVYVSFCKWCKVKLFGVVIFVVEMGIIVYEFLVIM